MVPAVTLGVLHRVSIEVAIIIALPCPLLLLAIGVYARWRWQAINQDPIPVAYKKNLMRPATTLHSTTAPQSVSVNTASTHSGGDSETKGMAALSQTAVFHDDRDASETGLLLNNEPQLTAH